uniref:Uncharacterized protein n=1 Tax=Leptobrachium leishanense TaxID=445787 RepID=A0A8C5QNF0_9ANUR
MDRVPCQCDRGRRYSSPHNFSCSRPQEDLPDVLAICSLWIKSPSGCMQNLLCQKSNAASTRGAEGPAHRSLQSRGAEGPAHRSLQSRGAEGPAHRSLQSRGAEGPAHRSLQSRGAEDPAHRSLQSRGAEGPAHRSLQSRGAEGPAHRSLQSRGAEGPAHRSLQSRGAEGPAHRSLQSRGAEGPAHRSLQSRGAEGPAHRSLQSRGAEGPAHRSLQSRGAEGPAHRSLQSRGAEGPAHRSLQSRGAVTDSYLRGLLLCSSSFLIHPGGSNSQGPITCYLPGLPAWRLQLLSSDPVAQCSLRSSPFLWLSGRHGRRPAQPHGHREKDHHETRPLTHDWEGQSSVLLRSVCLCKSPGLHS